MLTVLGLHYTIRNIIAQCAIGPGSETSNNGRPCPRRPAVSTRNPLAAPANEPLTPGTSLCLAGAGPRWQSESAIESLSWRGFDSLRNPASSTTDSPAGAVSAGAAPGGSRSGLGSQSRGRSTGLRQAGYDHHPRRRPLSRAGREALPSESMAAPRAVYREVRQLARLLVAPRARNEGLRGSWGCRESMDAEGLLFGRMPSTEALRR